MSAEEIVSMIQPAEASRKWAARTSSASQDYVAGVQRVTVAPGQRAAAAADLWQAKLAQPSTKAKFQKAAAAVSLSDWQTAASTKGASRLASGAQAAEPKMQAFMAKALPYIASGLGAINSMPNLTLEDGISRAAAWSRYMAKFSK